MNFVSGREAVTSSVDDVVEPLITVRVGRSMSSSHRDRDVVRLKVAAAAESVGTGVSVGSSVAVLRSRDAVSEADPSTVIDVDPLEPLGEPDRLAPEADAVRPLKDTVVVFGESDTSDETVSPLAEDDMVNEWVRLVAVREAEGVAVGGKVRVADKVGVRDAVVDVVGVAVFEGVKGSEAVREREYVGERVDVGVAVCVTPAGYSTSSCPYDSELLPEADRIKSGPQRNKDAPIVNGNVVTRPDAMSATVMAPALLVAM